MKEIYYGSNLCPPLYYEDDKESGFFGWLFVRHPDGQLVTIANLMNITNKKEI